MGGAAFLFAMAEQITFDAVVSKVSTLADGGIRLTLDLPETAVMAAAQMMECKRLEVALSVLVKVLPGLTNGKDETDKRAASHPSGVAGG